VEWTTACPDWRRRIVAREPLIVSPPLFPSEADAAWEICSGLRLVDIGGATLGEVALPWTEQFIRAVFGSYNPDDGRRYINEYLLMLSKKNAKSTIAAAIMLTALIMNWRPSAELLILSPTKEIADNSYKPMRDMVRADPALGDHEHGILKVQDYFRTVTHRETGATLKVVAADSDTVSGKKASFVFVDELHEFGKQAKASNMLLEATGGLTSRPEGFVIYATTQSAEPPAGVFREKLDYARKVRDGTHRDRKFLPLIYEFPEDMIARNEHENLENAYITNPNWGASVDIARVEQLHSQAREVGENGFKEFLAKHLNVEIGMNLRSNRWAGADFWEAAGEPGLTLDALLDRCEVAVVGIDGGGLDDLLGLAVIGREKDTGCWLHWGHAWAHKIALERRKEIAPRLLDFERDGDLTIVPIPGPDVAGVADVVERVRHAGLLPERSGIGVDGNGIGAVVKELASRGFSADQGRDIIAIPQNWRLGAAIKDCERMLAGGELVHGASALMAWSVGNAMIETKRNNIYVTKHAAGTAKIDPLMALFDAVSLMALNPEGSASVYETRGAIVF
jgi:phage terminase large subunit-like protein